MTRAVPAVQTTREKSVIFVPYPSAVDPDDITCLAFNPKKEIRLSAESFKEHPAHA